MKRYVPAVFAAILLLAWLTPGRAFAHASLQSSNIKNGQVFRVGHAPTVIKAFFAENLIPADSWINVFEGVADHGLVNETTRSHVNFRNPKEITLKLPRLSADKYYFVWYTHSADDHHWAAGVVYFRVVK